MFARQRDVIIRHPEYIRRVRFSVPCYSGRVSRILFYVRRRALLLPGIYHPIHLPAICESAHF